MSDPDDKAFDDYLNRQGPVSDRYRQLDDAEPPAQLDGIVLARAAQAVRRPARSSAWMRWGAPIALAASMVLVVAVVMESGVEDQPISVTSTASDRLLRSHESTGFRDAVEADASKESSRAPPAAQAAAPGEAVAEAPSAPTSGRRDEPATPASDRERLAGVPLAAAKVEKMVGEEPVAPPPSPSVDVPATTPPTRAISQVSARSPGGAVPVPAYQRFSSQADVDAELRRLADPDAWLEHIRQLRREQKVEEADRQWREFRAAYPDHAVAETDDARPE